MEALGAAGPAAAASAHDQVGETKLIASLVLFLITLTCGYLPVRMILNQNCVQHAMFAGGGVLMATAFCHLIPEAHDSYKAASNHSAAHHLHDQRHEGAPQNTSNPLGANSGQTGTNLNLTTTTTTTTTLTNSSALGEGAAGSFMGRLNALNVPYLELTLCCGFFFMYLVEQLMLRFIANHSHEHPCDTAKRPPAALLVGVQQTGDLLAGYPQQPQQQHENGANVLAAGADYVSAPGQPGGPASSPASSTAGSASVGNLSTAIIVAPASGGAKGGKGGGAGRRRRLSTSSRMGGDGIGRGGGGDGGGGSLGPRAIVAGAGSATELYKFLRGLLIVSAFGTHSIFDGVAIGSQDSVEKVWTIFVAISCHKLIIAAVVGLELFAATLESHLWTLVHLVLFSAMSPIGIILVVVAQDALNIDSEHPAMILLQSFATGTLLYIIFVEILQPKEDQYHAKNRLGKSISLIGGFALMLTALTLLDHH